MRGLFVLGFALVLSACVTNRVSPSESATSRTQPVVHVDGRVVAASTDGDATAFIAQATRASQLGGDRALDRLVLRFPDRALEATQKASGSALVDAISAAYARSCTAHAALARGLSLAEDRWRAGDRAAAEQTLDAALAAGGEACDPLLFARAIELDAELGRGGRARLCERKAVCESRRGDYESSLADWTIVLDSCSEADRARVEGERARVLHALGRDEEAQRGLAPALASHDVNIACRAAALSGAIAAKLDQLEIAVDFYRRALAPTQRWPGDAAAHADLGVVLIRSEQREAGLQELTRARELFAADGDSVGLVRTMDNLSLAFLAGGDRAAADSSTAESRRVSREAGIVFDP